jgi:RNA polymerase sigma-70 factor (ECF subfamily)
MGSDEKTLYQKIIAGDEKTILYFYKSNKKALLCYIQRSILNKEDSEEILQDTYLAFIENLRNFRFQSSLKTFLFSIAKNKIIDLIRKNKIKQILFSFLPKGLIESLSTFLFDDEINRIFLAKKIDQTFDMIPKKYALVLRLKYQDGYRVVEIANKLCLSQKATESMIFRARQLFIQAYNKKYDR